MPSTADLLDMLFSYLFFLPIVMFCAGVLVKWLVMGEVETWAGIVGLIGVMASFAICVASRSMAVQISSCVGMVSLMVFFPFAGDYLARQDLRCLTAEHIDRGHAELAIRPDNFPAWFQLARNLYDFGYRGHAIAIAEQTMERIPNVPDPMSNATMRDLFRNEDYEIRRWRRESENPKYFRPVPCTKCKNPNPPGTINCQRCGAPYILELSRKTPGSAVIYSKLVVGWAVIAAMIPGAALLSERSSGGLGAMIVLGSIAIGIVILVFLFRPPSGVIDNPRPFS